MAREFPDDVGGALDRVGRALWTTPFANAQWHRANFLPHRNRYAFDLETLAAIAPRGARIADLGCAPGHFLAAARLLGHDCVGVDLAPDRIGDFARHFDLEVKRCDIEREPLPFGDESLDVAVLAETFEHLRFDPLYALSQINRVLKPGGRLLFSTPNLHSIQNIGRFLTGRSISDPLTEFGKLRGIGHMGHVREYSTREIRRLLNAYGFAIETLRYRHFHFPPTARGRLARVAFAILPQRFRTFQTMVCIKTGNAPRLSPL